MLSLGGDRQMSRSGTIKRVTTSLSKFAEFVARLQGGGLALAILLAVLAVCYYIALLTAGRLGDFFDQDPYGGIYPNLWQHALRGDFGIDPKYAFREYFITESGMNTVYFGFMPALVRGLASIFNGDLYAYSAGNLSIILAYTLAIAALIFALNRLQLFTKKSKYHANGFLLAVLFASPLSYLAIWGRVHNEAIAWGVAWSIIFFSFYALWTFGARQQGWYATLMGLSLGMAVLCRPTMALSLAIPFVLLVVFTAWKVVKNGNLKQLARIAPGVICATLLILFAMFINYQRWGNPLTFVEMDRHVELLKENPKRGADLRAAGEFNANRLPTSLAYYLLPTRDNLSTSPPFVEIDQRLTIMRTAPQYDYIEGSRVPVVMSMGYLLLIGVLALVRMKELRPLEKYATTAVLAGGAVTLLALCTVYALALRYSTDLLPAVIFCGIVYIILHHRETRPRSKVMSMVMAAALFVSIFVTVLTTLQYKIISGQIGLSLDFKDRLSRQINFAPEQDAKLFIINGVPAPAPLYRK